MKERLRKLFLQITPIAMLLIVFLAAIVGVKIKDRMDRNSSPERRQDRADGFVDTLYYVKDQSTGICFARSRGDYGFAAVPCEGIPPNLLTVGRVR